MAMLNNQMVTSIILLLLGTCPSWRHQWCHVVLAFAAFALLGMLLGAAETTARAAGAEAVLMVRPERSHRRYVITVYDMYIYIY